MKNGDLVQGLRVHLVHPAE